MANPSKRKGTAFETDVVRYLQANGWPESERRALSGGQDKGDIVNVTNWALECKAVATITLGQFVDEARVEGKNAGATYFAAIVKRRGKGVSEAFAVMPLDLFARLTVALAGIERAA